MASIIIHRQAFNNITQMALIILHRQAFNNMTLKIKPLLLSFWNQHKSYATLLPALTEVSGI